jgi:hypothetical protein
VCLRAGLDIFGEEKNLFPGPRFEFLTPQPQSQYGLSYPGWVGRELLCESGIKTELCQASICSRMFKTTLQMLWTLKYCTRLTKAFFAFKVSHSSGYFHKCAFIYAIRKVRPFPCLFSRNAIRVLRASHNTEFYPLLTKYVKCVCQMSFVSLTKCGLYCADLPQRCDC